uniref:Ras guanyl-releasing protein 3 n=1 Tax=Macrostomum lignano TaxID=282301 RepID=A0A1I8HEX7_9PLAT
MKKDRVSSSRVNSLVFNQLEAEQLAEQLTVLEFKAFRRIRIPDLKAYTSGESLRGSPTLERCVLLFNGLCQWVQCMVLSKSTPAERARVVAKFLEVSEELLKLNNFNTLMSVVGGLSHSAIARLSKTHACLSQRSQKLLVDLTEFLSSSSNFSNYRKEYAEAKDFKIPILAVHLKDLIQLNVAVPDKLSGTARFINWRKVVQLSQTLGLLHAAQRAPLPVEENVTLCNTLRLSLDCHHTEDDIYEVSLLREPRSLFSPSTPTKPVVFAQWVSGSKPPHPETLKRHIFDMAVFRVYDHDKDEMISETEFAQIAENFPFIDSFAVLDADNDGMISKNELKNYFIRANSHALKSSFKHDFHETSYFKPTFCDRCNGLLWGLIKQGWKCRDCGINVHKHCKDTVVMECRVRAQGQQRGAAAASDSAAAMISGSNSTVSTIAGATVTPGVGCNGASVAPTAACCAGSATGCSKAIRDSGSSSCGSPQATSDGWAQTDEDAICIDEARKLAQASVDRVENAELRKEAESLRLQVQSQAQVITRLHNQVTGGCMASSIAKEADEAAWCLVDAWGNRYWLPQDSSFVIGRLEGQLLLKSAGVENRHAMVSFDPSLQRYRLKDLGTSDGTFVNDQPVVAADSADAEHSGAVLEAGDSLRLGRDPSGCLQVARFAASASAGARRPNTATAAKVASSSQQLLSQLDVGDDRHRRAPSGPVRLALSESAQTHPEALTRRKSCTASLTGGAWRTPRRPTKHRRSAKKLQKPPPPPPPLPPQPQPSRPPQKPPRQPEAFSVPLSPKRSDANNKPDSGGGSGGSGGVLHARSSLSSFVPQRLQRVIQERDRQRRVAAASAKSARPAAAAASVSSVGQRRNSIGRGLQLHQQVQQHQQPGQNRLRQLRRGSAPALAPQPPQQPQSRPAAKELPPSSSAISAGGSALFQSKELKQQKPSGEQLLEPPRRSPSGLSKQQPQDEEQPAVAARLPAQTSDEAQEEAAEPEAEDAASEAGTYTISDDGSSDGACNFDSGSEAAEPAGGAGQELELMSTTTADTVDAPPTSAAADPSSDTSGPQAESHLLACSLHQLSKKLHRCADDLLTKLRRQNGDGRAPRTPSPEADPAGAAAVPGTSCGSGGGSQLLQSELLGCLRHLQAVQLQV